MNRKKNYHSGSSLVLLGFSIVAFVISYGLIFTVAASVLGTVWTTMNATNMPIPDPTWQTTYNDTQTQLQFLLPLIPSIGIMLIVLKVLMIASNRGRD